MFTLNISTRQFIAEKCTNATNLLLSPFFTNQFVDVHSQSKNVFTCPVYIANTDAIDVIIQHYIGSYAYAYAYAYAHAESGAGVDFEPKQFNELENETVLTIVDFTVSVGNCADIVQVCKTLSLQPFSMVSMGSRSESLLTALTAGFIHLREHGHDIKPMEMFVENCPVTASYLKNLDKWQKNGWRSTKGEPLKYANELQTLYDVVSSYKASHDALTNARLYLHQGILPVQFNIETMSISKKERSKGEGAAERIVGGSNNNVKTNTTTGLNPTTQSHDSVLMGYLKTLQSLKNDVKTDNVMPNAQQQTLIELLENAKDIILNGSAKGEGAA